MGHDRDRSRPHSPGMSGRAVEHLLHLLDLDEMVSTAHRSEMAVAAVRRSRAAHIVFESKDSTCRQRAAEVDAIEVRLLLLAIVATPEPRAGVVVAGREKAGQPLAQQRLALPWGHRKVPPALEETGAQRRREPVEQRLDLAAGEI